MNKYREITEKITQRCGEIYGALLENPKIPPCIRAFAEKLKEKFLRYKGEYGTIGVVSAAAVPVKLLIFYLLVGVNSYFAIVWLLTCFFTFSLFNAFRKNKWIPAAVYAVFSLLLFCDVTYCSFFNRYLSVNMLGVAGYLGDIAESIKAVIRPVNFTMFVDAVLIFATLVLKRRNEKKLPPEGEDSRGRAYKDGDEENSKEEGSSEDAEAPAEEGSSEDAEAPAEEESSEDAETPAEEESTVKAEKNGEGCGGIFNGRDRLFPDESAISQAQQTQQPQQTQVKEGTLPGELKDAAGIQAAAAQNNAGSAGASLDDDEFLNELMEMNGGRGLRIEENTESENFSFGVVSHAGAAETAEAYAGSEAASGSASGSGSGMASEPASASGAAPETDAVSDAAAATDFVADMDSAAGSKQAAAADTDAGAGSTGLLYPDDMSGVSEEVLSVLERDGIPAEAVYVRRNRSARAKAIRHKSGFNADESNASATTDEMPKNVEITEKQCENYKEIIPSVNKKLNRGTFARGCRRFAAQIASVLIIVMLVFNIGGTSFVQAVSNQEIIAYHIKDIAGGAGVENTAGNLAAFTADYEREKDGPLFGVAAGRNVIVIQIESLQNFVIGREYNGQEITPNLNALLEDNTIYFDHYYQQVGSGNTSDAEFATNNSIYGTLQSFTYNLYDNNYFRGLPVLLKEKGYETAVLHAHEDRTFWNRENAYKVLGFDTYYGGLMGNPGGCFKMTEWMGWGLTDTEFFKQAIEYIKELTQPFYSFVITISNHHPYQMLDKYKFIDLLPEDRDTIVGNYIQSAAYTDYALGEFIQELKDAGVYDNSVIAMYGDHTGLAHSDEIDESMKRITGKTYDFDTLMSIPLIIHLPNSEYDIHQTVSTAGGQLDFLPTMAYLLGFDSLDTIYLGHNLLNIKEGFVAEQTQMIKGSFFLNDSAYEMSRDGVFENGRAWDLKTGKRIKDLQPFYDGYVRSTDIINTSEYILKSDAIRQMFLEGKELDAVAATQVKREYPKEIVDAGYPDASLVGTNSAEALQYSYDMGYRYIRIDTGWDKNDEPVTVDRSTGKQVLNPKQLIEWFSEHPDCHGIANVPKSGDYYLNFTGTQNPDVALQMILELPKTEEYSGRYEAILDASSAGQTAAELKEFIERNNVWAVVMDRRDEKKYSSLKDTKAHIYIRGNDGRTVEKTKENN
ncbi:MAG: LTA synthase family protein [Clostridia bacterium]|nr:LTA synthase family protein [Clostridia bacterium]